MRRPECSADEDHCHDGGTLEHSAADPLSRHVSIAFGTHSPAVIRHLGVPHL